MAYRRANARARLQRRRDTWALLNVTLFGLPRQAEQRPSRPSSCRRFRGAVEVQIKRVELAGLLETFPVQSGQRSGPQFDQAIAPQFLKRAVDVDCREAKGISDFCLRDRQLTLMPVRQPYSLHFHHHLTENVGDARVSRAATDTNHPLTE